jgi:hypothetical protein
LANIHTDGFKEDDKPVDGQSDQFIGEVGNLFDLIQKSATDRGKIWQAAIDFGARALEYRAADSFFSIIELWAKPAFKDDRLRVVLCDLLAEVFRLTQPIDRKRIFNQLNKWERQTKDETLSSIARSAKFSIESLKEFQDYQLRLAGDSTTDAPLPEGKKKRKPKGR